jgi:hypothetical protein
MVLPGPATVATGVLAWAVREERLGEPHPVLAPTARWRPRTGWAEAKELAHQEFARLGWLDRRGRLDVDVVAALAVLCRADSECYGWISEGGHTIAVLTAATGRPGLLAIRDGDLVRLSHIRSTELAEKLVAQLPPVPAARTQPLRVLRDELAVTTRDGRRRSETGVIFAPAGTPARLVRQLGALPTLGTAELHVAVRDSAGRHRAAQPLRCVDTSRGRYFYLIRNGEVLVAPGGRAELVARLRELVRTVSR